MKLTEVLIAMLVFSIFALGVMSQIDAESKFYLHRIENLNKLEAKITTLR
jgi:hypothetical protein